MAPNPMPAPLPAGVPATHRDPCGGCLQLHAAQPRVYRLGLRCRRLVPPDQQVAPVQVAVLKLAGLLRHPHRQRGLQRLGPGPGRQGVMQCGIRTAQQAASKGPAAQVVCRADCQQGCPTGLASQEEQAATAHDQGSAARPSLMSQMASLPGTPLPRPLACSRMDRTSSKERSWKCSRSAPPSATTNTCTEGEQAPMMPLLHRLIWQHSAGSQMTARCSCLVCSPLQCP